MSIREKVEDLRRELNVRYGADFVIKIIAYDHDNKMKPETAERIVEMAAADLQTEMSELKHPTDDSKNPLRWYNVDNHDLGIECTVFYNESQ